MSDADCPPVKESSMPQDTETQRPELRHAEEPAPQTMGIVERLTRDDSDRKRFLKVVGGAGAASFGAFVLAACGSSSTSSTTTKAAATAASTASANKGDLA